MSATVHVSANSRRNVIPVWWALAFGGLTTVGLGVLTYGLLILDALVYGTTKVIAPETGIAVPEGDRYGLAFAVGVIVNLVSGPALIWLATRTRARTWPPVALGLCAALVAAVAATCALLLTLGINPIDFVLAL